MVDGHAQVGSSNRLQLAIYDPYGNLTHLILGGETTEYVYDSANMMKSLSSSADQARIFIYNADDERILTFDCAGLGVSTCASSPAKETWTLRGLGNEVLRVWTHPFGGNWRWDTDYIYRGGQLLAAVAPDSAVSSGETTAHFHPDHLGSPRQVTGPTGSQLSQHSYYPFGSEATDPAQDDFQLKFTGHERDENGGGKGVLDYMHARHCSPVLGRFLAVDPVRGRAKRPQSWNRYAYALNSPTNYTDPTGERTAADFAEDTGELLLDAEEYIDLHTEGDLGGILLNFLAGSAVDLVEVFVLELFKAGQSTGDALGSGAEGRELVLAIGADSLRVAGLVGGLAGGARALTVKGLPSVAGAAPGGTLNPKIYRQLEKQLSKDGPASIPKALRSAERTLEQHRAKLPGLEHKSQVEGTIRNVENQIETLKQFIKDQSL
jgi:RHS repeat-associated protein